MAEASWRLKLQRAEKHFGELDDLLVPYGEVNEYEVRESVEHKSNKRPMWVYRVFGMEPQPEFSIILGDFLFNVRSALDHIAVALVPSKRKDSASFPICTIDPHEIHSNDLKGDAARLRNWKTATEGTPSDALAVIEFFQPYNAQPGDIYRGIKLLPEDTILAVLSAFQNADKHRRLVTTASGLIPESVILRRHDTGEVVPTELVVGPQHLGQNGAAVRLPYQVEVEAKGRTQIAASISKNERGPYRRLPDLMIDTLSDACRIIDALEACS